MIDCIKKICIACVTFCFTLAGYAQNKTTFPAIVSLEKTAESKSGPKPYKDVITNKAVTTKGFFTVHKLDDKYFLEIPPQLLGRDILVVNRVSKSSVESPKTFSGYAGDQIAENVIRFEKGPNSKVFLKN